MTDKFYLTRYANPKYEYIGFDNVDAKGRKIGCVIERTTAEFKAEPSSQYHAYFSDKWLGVSFTACVEATRNGQRYGASQSTSHFRTEAEREAFIAKRIAASRKAAAKK